MTHTVDIRVAENGRLILPLSVRKAMGLSGESKVIATIDGVEVRLTPITHGISRARELYRQHAKVDRTTADFLADRAEEEASHQTSAIEDDA